VTVESQRCSPLADRTDDLVSASTPELRIMEVPFLSQVSLRVNPDGDAARAVEQRLGLPLPTEPNTVAAAGGRAVLWLGPDEWLVVGPDGDADALVGLLDGARCAVDVSANRTTVEVSGRSARDLLEKGVALDLHPRAFGAGNCASTLLARTQVVLWQTSDEPAYRLLVRGSFAGYLAGWLVDAAREYAVGAAA